MVCQPVFINVFFIWKEGFSEWLAGWVKQSAEEIEHAYAIAGMIKRGNPKVDKVDVFHWVGGNLLKYSSMLWSMKTCSN